jgi:DNA invertase Pin-like site-specific DNA recombinase
MARIKYKEASGLEVKKGRPPIGKKPDKSDLKKLYTKESRSIREIAEILGCSKDRVYRSLQEYGIERRPHSRISKLSNYGHEELRDIVLSEGYRGAARSLGVGYTTLRLYLKRRD